MKRRIAALLLPLALIGGAASVASACTPIKKCPTDSSVYYTKGC